MIDSIYQQPEENTSIKYSDGLFYNGELIVSAYINLTGYHNGQLGMTVIGLGNLGNEDQELIETHTEALKALILKSIKLKQNIKSSTKKKKNV